jgi:predicted DNA-binding transcriptional regulator AlpA
MTAIPEPLWTEAQTAAVIGVEPKTLNIWRTRKAAHQPPYVKVGRLVRYRPSAVAAWVESRERR